MGTKTDFTQKLLRDLRLRKEQMATAQTPADAYRGSSRNPFKQTKNAKTVHTIDTVNKSTQRSSTTSKLPNQQSANQIVPYGGGHKSGQKTDVSMAIAYAFDDVGKLKAFELKSNNGAMVNLLQKIGRKSMRQTSHIPANQFPTLTNLHIDEIARGAQKLNHILNVCTSGLNIDKSSIEVGQELWQGAMELEHSLRMLVSLQEASNCMIKPQRKSRLKLLEEGEDCDDDSIPMVKQKQVERPVFSFDKPSKLNKEPLQTDLQQKQQALTHLKEDPITMPEKQESKILKSSHRRSTSCGPVFQASQQTNSSNPKQNAPRLPNVIAKLMGLEERSQNSDQELDTRSQTWSKHRSGEIDLRTSHGYSKKAEFKIEEIKDAKVQLMTSRVENTKTTTTPNTHEPQQQKTYQITCMGNDNNYRTTPDQQNLWNEEKRVGTRNHVKESQEAIYKINELQSQVIQRNAEPGSRKNSNKDARANSTTQMQQEVKHATKKLHRLESIEKRSSGVSNKTKRASMATAGAHEVGSVANKPPITQQENKTLQQGFQVYEPLDKKHRADNRIKNTVNSKSQQRKRAANLPKSNKFQTLSSHSKNLQKGQNAKALNADGELAAADLSISSKENKDHATGRASRNSNVKGKTLASPNSGQSEPLTDMASQLKACNNSNESTSISRRDIAGQVTTQHRDPRLNDVKTNQIATNTVKTATIMVEKLTVPEEAAKPSNKTSNHTNATSGSCGRPMQEEMQEGVSAHFCTVDCSNGDKSYSQEDLAELPSCNRSEDTTSTVADSQKGQQPIVDTVQKIKDQKTETDSNKDGTSSLHNPTQEQQRTTIEIQQPLTENQIILKQKLIQSHIFLNTAEALFKLNIPIGILNYASDQLNHDKDSKLLLDCCYELLKRKGRIKEMSLYPNIRTVMKCTEVTTLDNLVRQLHKALLTLQSHGRNKAEEYDEVEYLLKMLERDIYHRAPNVNCMWDLGWSEMVFAYTDAEETIRDVEHSILDELLNEIVGDSF